MRILRRDRGGDLKGPNSPYRLERATYWTCQCIRHPLTMPAYLWHRSETFLAADGSNVSPLWIYGGPQFGIPLYTGVDIADHTIYGDSTTLRHLAGVLNDRADHYDRIAAKHAAGQPVTYEDHATADWLADTAN